MAFRVMELIRNLHREGCTVIVATHDLSLIRAFRARTLLIKDRKLHEVRLAEHRGPE
jgi:ABC-type ATPase involved in cell division